LPLPIVFECFERHIRQYAIDAFDRLDDVVKRGTSERAITKTRERLSLLSLPAGSCAGCRAS
jgi:hypothetical protein